MVGMNLLTAKVTYVFFPTGNQKSFGWSGATVCLLLIQSNTTFLMPFYQSATAGFFHATCFHERGNCKHQDVFYGGCTS
jgi:hypothetical protein